MPKESPVEKMIKTKTQLISRLRQEIKDIQEDAKKRVERVEFNIRRAQVILDALKAGSLKP